jgi:hypothetical protein
MHQPRTKGDHVTMSKKHDHYPSVYLDKWIPDTEILKASIKSAVKNYSTTNYTQYAQIALDTRNATAAA